MVAAILPLLLTCTCGQHCHGQADTDRIDTNLVLIDPETPPSFPGGESELFCFIDHNIDKGLLRSVDITGSVFAQFTVDTTGHIFDIKIIKSLNKTVDDELIRIISLMPQWKPGRAWNKAVEVKYVLPLKVPYVNRCH